MTAIPRRTPRALSQSDAVRRLKNCLISRYDQLRAMLCALDLGLTEEEIQDVLQQALVIALHAIRTGKAMTLANRWYWLRGVARNLAFDLFRAKRRVRHCEFEAVDPSSAPPDEAITRDLQEKVRTAVAALPPNLRKLVEAHHFEGETYAELSGRLGIPTSTISRRLAKARRIMAGLLAKVAENA